jgi:predicted O-linked N-acetylglucosamine transferase (SPINDLY family)
LNGGRLWVLQAGLHRRRSLPVQRAYLKAELCDWHEAEPDAAQVLDIMRHHPGVVPPWNLQGLPSTAADRLLCAQQWSRLQTSGQLVRLARRPPTTSRKIRLGYFSADFREHPVGYAIAETIEHHDRNQFETFAYSCGPDDGSGLRRRFETAFDCFRDLRTAGNEVAAQQIHDDRIDILIDLTTHTRYARPRIPAARPAPIQVNYLGFVGTTGANWIDYILVDDFVVPPEQAPFFSEKLVHLAGCWWPATIRWEFKGTPPTRSACGLPKDGFVFSCFNTNHKITAVRPANGASSRIASSVPRGSRF